MTAGEWVRLIIVLVGCAGSGLVAWMRMDARVAVHTSSIQANTKAIEIETVRSQTFDAVSRDADQEAAISMAEIKRDITYILKKQDEILEELKKDNGT